MDHRPLISTGLAFAGFGYPGLVDDVVVGSIALNELVEIQALAIAACQTGPATVGSQPFPSCFEFG